MSMIPLTLALLLSAAAAACSASAPSAFLRALRTGDSGAAGSSSRGNTALRCLRFCRDWEDVMTDSGAGVVQMHSLLATARLACVSISSVVAAAWLSELSTRLIE